MKRIAILFITFSLTLSAAAQKNNTTEKWPTFLTQAQLPDGTKYLSAPPDTSSIAYLNDFHQYQWGKSMRGTERGQQAVFDANVTIDSIMKSFAEPFGIRITKSNAPEIYYLVERVETMQALPCAVPRICIAANGLTCSIAKQRRCLSKKRNCATAVLIRQVIRHADGRLLWCWQKSIQPTRMPF